MKNRVLIVLILTAIWAFGSWWYYTCKIKGFCSSSDTASTATSAIPPQAVAPKTVLDTDADALTDEEEADIGTDPTKADTDGDSIPDNEEVGSDPSSPINTDGDDKIDALDDDDDNDNVPTLLETALGTDPLQDDTDADGLSDGAELGTNPGEPLNTDGDQLINALDPDDDGDGVPTVEETMNGTDPLVIDNTIEASEEAADEAPVEVEEPQDTVVETPIDKADAEKAAEKKPEDAPTEDKMDENKVDEEKPAEQKPADDEVTVETVDSASTDTIKGSLLYFPFRSAEPKLSKSASEYFANVAAWLKESKDNQVFLIGHTDNVGSKTANKRLGLKRAQMVRGMLVKQGAPKAQIKTTSKGETKPIRSNRTKSGRKKNRRVELTPKGQGVSK